MAHYTNVSLVIDNHVVATSPHAEVGLPGAHRLTATDVSWKNGPRSFVNYLQKKCVVKATGPDATPVALNLTVSGIMGSGTTVHLD